MFENIMNFFKKLNKKETKVASNSKEAAKERLHLVLMQDRANVSADFLELMKQEIIEVIKKYIDVDESAIDVRLTNKENGDGTNGAPALYANIPILNIKNEARKVDAKTVTTEEKKSDKKIVEKEDKKDNNIENKQEEEKIEEDKSKKSNSETEEATDLNVDVKTKKTEEKIKSED
jgi:cell division topological specificity factor